MVINGDQLALLRPILAMENYNLDFETSRSDALKITRLPLAEVHFGEVPTRGRNTIYQILPAPTNVVAID